MVPVINSRSEQNACVYKIWKWVMRNGRKKLQRTRVQPKSYFLRPLSRPLSIWQQIRFCRFSTFLESNRGWSRCNCKPGEISKTFIHFDTVKPPHPSTSFTWRKFKAAGPSPWRWRVGSKVRVDRRICSFFACPGEGHRNYAIMKPPEYLTRSPPAVCRSGRIDRV